MSSEPRRVRVSSLRLWMFGLALAVTILAIALGWSQLQLTGHIEPVMWALGMAAEVLWFGGFAALVRDDIVERLQERNDRCVKVSERLDVIEEDLVELSESTTIAPVRIINGRRLHPVE